MAPLLLLHSPLVGPATWSPVAARLRAAGHEAVVADPRSAPDLPRPLLVAHCNAGLHAPSLAARLDAVATVYVDAALAGPGSEAALVPPPS